MYYRSGMSTAGSYYLQIGCPAFGNVSEHLDLEVQQKLTLVEDNGTHRENKTNPK